jgi:type III secretory pathway component EscT
MTPFSPWPAGLLAGVLHALARRGIDLPGLALAWARVMPAVAVVPAFGLRALPVPARAVLAMTFAASIVPAVTPVAPGGPGGLPLALPLPPVPPALPWTVHALAEAVGGLPVALAAAVPLWAATMAGGVADALRGAQDTPSAVVVVEGRATPLGIPLSLLASTIFLWGGGPARVVAALAVHPLHGGSAADPFVRAAHDLTNGVTLAVALGGPLLAASVVVELAGALIARAAAPAQVHVLLSPLRALATLSVMALVLDRLASALSSAIAATP